MKEKNKLIKTLYEVSIVDCQDLWFWRNEELTRNMAKNSNFISWDTHKLWFETCMKSKYVNIYIAKDIKGYKLGMCRFEIEKNLNFAEISISIFSAKRGRSLSTNLLKMAIQKFEKKKNCILKATIKKINIASIKCFTKCGFTLISQDKKFNYYECNRT